jgi:Flp pilus assembly protein TadG
MSPELPTPLRRSRGERGTALIEFALVLPFLLLLTFCVVDISRAFWIKNTTHQAARESVRYLVVHTVADSGDARQRALDVLNPAGVTLSQYSIGTPASRYYEVTVGVQFAWLFPGLFTWLGAEFDNPMTVQATAVMRREG